MKVFAVVVTHLFFFGLLGSPAVVLATSYDLGSILPNAGFESGLTGWNYTGAGVNSNTYLTNTEWSGQTWSSSSPFYTDAALAGYYPGKPWGLNPDITHVNQTGVPSGPTSTITAPVGSNFVGSRQDGYQGHFLTGGVPDTPASYYDTNFQLTSTSINNGGSGFQIGDVFTLTVWGNRGRLRQDYGVINANTTGNASTLSLRLFGEGGASDYNVALDFTNWAIDGIWASQTFQWTLDRNVSSLQLFVTGQNKGHDRFAAVDMGTQPVPEPSTMLLLGSGLIGLAGYGKKQLFKK